MDHFEKLTKQARLYIAAVLFAAAATAVGLFVLFSDVIGLNIALAATISLILLGAGAYLASIPVVHRVLAPLKMLREAILHVSPENTRTSAPNLDTLRLGHELVTSLSLQVYQMASTPGQSSQAQAAGLDERAKIVISSLPNPLFVVNKDQAIVFANVAAHTYLGVQNPELIGKNIYSVLDLSFPTEDTLDSWLATSRTSAATASKSWEHVRLKLADAKLPKQFDMSAYYNRDNPSGIETILTLFDRTTTYARDDQDIGYVALAVHELRTPLTLLRGYIELFEDELGGQLTPELKDFMYKMQASAQQLAAFVNNILNVARVESDQMILQLDEESWPDIVKNVVEDMNLRAQIHGRTITYTMPDNLPTVGADRVSVYEVLANLLDNAIKYSGKSQKIVVSSTLTKEGLVETTVQDWGVGIPESVLPNLFEKFYRNHRTQAQVGGTGLGLYLCKAIIEAHGGNIWIRSKEGQGTVIGFTLQPYVMVAHKLKGSDNRDIVRGAHGWIKNHSLYRR